MKKLLKVILVELAEKPKIIKDSVDGHDVIKFRHVFMTEEGKELIAFADDEGYRTMVTPALEWNPDFAKPFLFESTSWQGNERLKLINKAQADAFLGAMKKTK